MALITSRGRYVDCTVIATILLMGIALPAHADQWSQERAELEKEFSEQLESLAQRCTDLGLDREAQFTRNWQIPRTPGRIYIFLPPTSGPEPVGDEGSPTRFWFDHFLEARRAHAEKLFGLAKKA